MNPIQPYHERFLALKSEKGIHADSEVILQLIETDAAGLNNYFMAALGMSTLVLRLGARRKKYSAIRGKGRAKIH